jgi:AcrR family transcriptional regulator
MSKASNTRLSILQKSFKLIYIKGYQTTSLDDILATTEVTKGAFYYHFKNKDEMGVAIVEEILKPIMHQAFIAPISTSINPLDDIYKMIHDLLLENQFLSIQYGCPVGNLTQEMTPWNGQFSKALLELIDSWQNALIDAIIRGRKAGKVKKSVVPQQVAYFVMSGYWGIRNFGKVENSNTSYKLYLKELKHYLNALK